MKLRVPSGCGAASHNGRAVDIDVQGCVDVEEDVALALAAHGFSAMDDIEAGCDVLRQHPHAVPRPEERELRDDGIGQLNRRALFAFLKANGVGVCLPITNDELRVLARRVLAKPDNDLSADEGS
jgi:hypothetical protein